MSAFPRAPAGRTPPPLQKDRAMTPQLSRQEVVAGLIHLAAMAVERELTDDAAEILQGARILRPRLTELDLLEGWICIQRGQVTECIRLLRNAENSPTLWGMAKALMARCQYFLMDPAWRINAQEVAAHCKDPCALYVVRRLLSPQSGDDGEEKEDGDDTPQAPAPGPHPLPSAPPLHAAPPANPLANPFVFQLRA